jgi:RimJ/RimL family protein N-acetyltransferase
LLGAVGISKINHDEKQGELGYWLGKEHWGQGIMTEAAKAVVDFAFKEIPLQRINTQAVIENIGSNKVIQKLGFVPEGMKRKGMKSRATGKFHDCNQYGLLKEEWK